jgi:hypothetical protein
VEKQNREGRDLWMNKTIAKKEPSATRFARSDRKEISSNETGSAVAEFVLIALPLFIPALLFFITMNNSVKTEMEASYLARQAVRAFASGANDFEANLRLRALIDEFSAGQLDKSSSSKRIDYSIKCSSFPCISSGAEIEVTISIDGDREKPRVIALAKGRVDKW